MVEQVVLPKSSLRRVQVRQMLDITVSVGTMELATRMVRIATE